MTNQFKIMNFNQVKSQNFYVAYTPNGDIILKSYSTIVGIITPAAVYRVRYSQTTGKQITQFVNSIGFDGETIYTTAQKLHDEIKNACGLDLNTNYNMFQSNMHFYKFFMHYEQDFAREFAR